MLYSPNLAADSSDRTHLQLSGESPQGDESA